jgi:hypothetical protein
MKPVRIYNIGFTIETHVCTVPVRITCSRIRKKILSVDLEIRSRIWAQEFNASLNPAKLFVLITDNNK